MINFKHIQVILMLQHIATVAVYVEDQKKSLEFWTKKMGFELKANNQMTHEYHWYEVAPKGAQACVVIYPKALMPNWSELKPSIMFQCDSVEKTYQILKEKGVEFVDPQKKWLGGPTLSSRMKRETSFSSGAVNLL